jgi:hypothetical protein
MSRGRIVIFAVLALCAAAVAGVVIATREPARDLQQQAARERCERDVIDRLASPSEATLSEVTVASDELDPEITDLSTLSGTALKGVDHARISVTTVAGVVQAPNAYGDKLTDPFTCRAYFADGNLADTLVVFEHDH